MIWNLVLLSSFAILTSFRTPGAFRVFEPSITRKMSERLIASRALSSQVFSGAASFKEVSITSNGESSSLDCPMIDRKSTRLNSSHSQISYAVFCLKKKKYQHTRE